MVCPSSDCSGTGSPRDDEKFRCCAPAPPFSSLRALATEIAQGATEYGLILQAPSFGSRPPSAAGCDPQSDPPGGFSRAPGPLLPAANTTDNPASLIALLATLIGSVASKRTPSLTGPHELLTATIPYFVWFARIHSKAPRAYSTDGPSPTPRPTSFAPGPTPR